MGPSSNVTSTLPITVEATYQVQAMNGGLVVERVGALKTSVTESLAQFVQEALQRFLPSRLESKPLFHNASFDLQHQPSYLMVDDGWLLIGMSRIPQP